MDKYEVESGVSGLRNFKVPVPGTTVVAHLGVYDSKPHEWAYSLWEGETLLEANWLDFKGYPVTPLQVAQVAFTLDLDQATTD